MADLEDKLNAILSSPESMQKVTQLAQMLSEQNGGAAQQPPAPPPPPGAPDAPPDASALSALLGGMDLNMISRLLPLMQEMNSPRNDERAALLHALQPFLKPERRDKVDTALRLARLLHVGKSFFKGFGDGHV